MGQAVCWTRFLSNSELWLSCCEKNISSELEELVSGIQVLYRRGRNQVIRREKEPNILVRKPEEEREPQSIGRSGSQLSSPDASLAMPPKKNKGAKKAGRFKEEPEEVVEKVEKHDEEVEYDSDGNEIVQNVEEPEAAPSDAAPGKLSAREIVKLKKKKQKGLLTEEELVKYADILGVEERFVAHILYPVSLSS